MTSTTKFSIYVSLNRFSDEDGISYVDNTYHSIEHRLFFLALLE